MTGEDNLITLGASQLVSEDYPAGMNASVEITACRVGTVHGLERRSGQVVII